MAGRLAPAHWRMRLEILLLLRGSVYYVLAEFGTIRNTVYDCQYDLTEVQCQTCHGIPTANTDEYDPMPASCITSAQGCCRSPDGFEYFRKDSLASYGVGDAVMYFYPGESGAVIRYLSSDQPGLENYPPPGRCVWDADITVAIARCRILPSPPPLPPVPPSPPPSPSPPRPPASCA